MNYIKAFCNTTAQHFILEFAPESTAAEDLYKIWSTQHPNHYVIFDAMNGAGVKSFNEVSNGEIVYSEKWSNDAKTWIPTVNCRFKSKLTNTRDNAVSNFVQASKH
jgi:hypothetical protein